MALTITRRPEAILLNRINRMFDDAFGTWQSEGGEGTITSQWVPPCDVFGDSDTIKIIAEIPGVRPEDVKLSLENNTLTIRGEKRQVAEEKTERVHRYERSYGSFERVFSLPRTVDPGQGFLTSPTSRSTRPREQSRGGARVWEPLQVLVRVVPRAALLPIRRAG